MDNLLAISMAILGMIGFMVWLFRPQAPLAVRVLVTVCACIWLVWYVAVELLRSQPELWTGTAQMSVWTMIIIAVGIYVLVSKPNKANRDGGERSA